MVRATREHMFVKHGCYTMKNDVFGLPHKFKALRPRSVTKKNHNFSSRSEFIDLCYVAGRNSEGERYCEVAGDCGKRSDS